MPGEALRKAVPMIASNWKGIARSLGDISEEEIASIEATQMLPINQADMLVGTVFNKRKGFFTFVSLEKALQAAGPTEAIASLRKEAEEGMMNFFGKDLAKH